MSPLGVGLVWVGLDRRNQGWHEKMANTVGIRPAGEEVGNSEGGEPCRPYRARGLLTG